MSRLNGKVLVEVSWLDACSRVGDSLENLLNNDTADLLIASKTFGLLIKEDKRGYVVANCCNETNEYDTVIIPRSWVTEVKYYKRKV